MEYKMKPKQMKFMERLSLGAFFFHLLSGLGLYILSTYTQTRLCSFLSAYIFTTSTIWVITWLWILLRRLAADEESELKEAEEKRKIEGRSGALFEKDSMDALRAGKRLENFQKFFLPAFSLVYAALLGFIAYTLFNSITAIPTVERELLTIAIFICIGAAFVHFLFGWYTAALARAKGYRVLYAGAGFLAGIALMLLATVVALVFSHQEFVKVEYAMLFVLAGLPAVNAVEIVIKVIMDFYRPRQKGVEPYPIYSSRLLGLLTEPGRIMRTIAETIDYQFGFKVSDTWFYRFVEKAIAPLILFQVVALYLLTCIVVVEHDEKAILERFGQPLAFNAILDPGIHFKYPWPVEKVFRYKVKHIMKEEYGHDGPLIKDIVTWTEKHYETEYNLLVARRERTENHQTDREDGPLKMDMDKTKSDETKAPQEVNLAVLSAEIKYKIDENALMDYAYNSEDPQWMLRVIGYGEIIQFLASRDVMTLMKMKRQEACDVLHKRIQDQINTARIGIKVVAFLIPDIHPPIETAKSFEAVTGAIQEKEAKILKAQAYANRILPVAKGAAVAVNEASIAYKESRRLITEAVEKQFLDFMTAHDSAPEIFKIRKLMDVLEETLPNVRKYIVPESDTAHEVMILNFEEKMRPGLLDIPIDTQGE